MEELLKSLKVDNGEWIKILKVDNWELVKKFEGRK